MTDAGANAGKGAASTAVDSGVEHYGEYYERTADIESRVSHGLPLAERVNKEAAFALKVARVDELSHPGVEGGPPRLDVLDLASGTGLHADAMAEQLSGQGIEAHIDAGDISKTLVDQARQGQEAAVLQRVDATRARFGTVTFGPKDFLNIERQVEDGKQYDLITILGSSFMYLKNEEEHGRALESFFKLLVPGGRLVIQFRAGMGNRGEVGLAAQREWCESLGVEVGEAQIAAERSNRGVGKCAPEGATSVYAMHDKAENDGFYFYNVPPEEHPAFRGMSPKYDGSGKLEGFTRKEGDANCVYIAMRNGDRLTHFVDADGVEYSGFGRAYVDSSREEHDMGPAYVVDYMTEHGATVLKNEIMPPIGFTDIRLEQEGLSPEGSIKQYVLAAQKPMPK